MGEQLKEEDWLPEGLPEGWKVEIRVRKTGKKDRYYTDPEHGYIFRSIKDIDRYLLTGKLGRHVTKTPKESSTDNEKSEEIEHTSCLALAAQGQEAGENASKRKASSKAQDSKDMTKKRISKPCTGNPSRSSKKKESTPFFILDPEQCEESDTIDIPNLSEIIDSVRKEKEGRKTVYVSAPAIGSLLAGQTSEHRVKQDHEIKPQFSFNLCQHFSITPNMPYIPSLVKREEWETRSNVRPYQHAPPLETFSKLGTESRPIGVPGRPLFGNLLTDPCIDFAFKTLTGSVPLGNDMALEDCFSSQQHGSSRILSEGGPC